MKRRQVLIAAMAAAQSVRAEPVTSWKAATGYRADSFQGQNLLKFARDVEFTTGGALRIEVRSVNMTAPMPMEQIPAAVQDGQLQAGEVILTGW